MVKRIFLLFTLLFTLSVTLTAQDTEYTGAEILWDTWGVPHIYAENNDALFYAYGWAQAHNHATRILELYATSRGEGAKHFGQSALQTDIFVNILGVPARGRNWYDQQTPEFQGYLDAFAAGFNAYAEANPDAIGDHVKGVLPISGPDTLIHAGFVSQIGFIGSSMFGRLSAWNEANSESASAEETNGSNTWAIAPSRSASGNTMLLANPHLDWSGANTWMEAQLVSPDVNIYGASLIGMPVINIGFNEHLGWSHTVNTHDGYDLYEIENTGLGRYLLDGEEQQAQITFINIPVLQEDGTLQDHRQITALTEYGPVVAQSADGSKALAFRIIGLEASGFTYQQWWDMARATNLDEFTEAISRLDLPTQTIMYADREGNIMHVFNGEVPVRETGDFASWQEIQPGGDSSLIWDEVHTFEELPKVINPESGWLQNANEPPWTTTFPLALDYDDYPPYMAPEPFMTFRAQSSASMLYEDESITFDELREYKHSTEMELATRIVDDLVAAARASDDVIVNAAADVLEAWDLRTDADSRGAVLFQNWYNAYNEVLEGTEFFAVPFDLNAEPFTTPDGLGDAGAAVEALAAAATQVNELYGALDVPWGDVYRLQVGEYDFPANGGSGFLGEFRVVGYRAGEEEGQFIARRGDSWVAIIEFSDPVRAEVLVTYGNASQPGSPHVGDQLELFANEELRPAWFTREEVEANLNSVESF
ncbi:MAG: acylase [Anaerolineae bacterium]